MGDWFAIVENSYYRRGLLLAEARREHRASLIRTGTLRTGIAALLIQLALWLAPTAERPRPSIEAYPAAFLDS